MWLILAAMLDGTFYLPPEAGVLDDEVWNSAEPTWQRSSGAGSSDWTRPPLWTAASACPIVHARSVAGASSRLAPPQILPRSSDLSPAGARNNSERFMIPPPLPANPILPPGAAGDRCYQLFPGPELRVAEPIPIVQVEQSNVPEIRVPAASILPPLQTVFSRQE